MIIKIDIVILIILIYNIFSIAKTRFDKYCRNENRSITSDENDEYLLVDTTINSTVILLCRFCEQDAPKQPMLWYFQDRFQFTEEKEVELDMNNNKSYNRIYITPTYSLVIKDFESTDAGIYRCHGEQGQGKENKYNYRIEPIFEEETDINLTTGNLSDWQNYYETHLAPVTLQFAMSEMLDLVAIRDEGIILEVITEWGPWGPCEDCVRKKGFRTRRGFCRLKRQLIATPTAEENFSENSTLISIFKNTPMLPCNSMLLEEVVPIVSNATKNLPEFILKEPCKNCKKVKKKKRIYRYKKRYVLAEGAHLLVQCPNSTSESNIVWRKDSMVLKIGTEYHISKNKEPRILVDTFSTLYLLDVVEEEAGNYTCTVDDMKMMTMKVIVIAKSKLLTQAFFRHLIYLGWIFLFISFCYCAGLIEAYRRRDKFKGYEEIIKEK